MNTTPEKFRSFIGINPNAEVLAFLQSFKRQHSKDSWVTHIRWTAETNIHLTMRFLGDLTGDQIEQIKSGLEPVVKNLSPFSVTVSAPQPFPSPRKARMLASLVHKSETLEQLAMDIDELALNAGVAKEERPFRGHLTVGRFRNPMKHLDDLLQDTVTTSMPIDHIILFNSHLKYSGAEYVEVGKFLFQSV
jgi:2'-5' RNA ligase